MKHRPTLPSLFGGHLSPRRPLTSFPGELERLFDAFARGSWPMSAEDMKLPAGVLAPDMDVVETDKGVEITAELPGVAEDDVDISVDGRTVTIRGEKKAESEKKDADYHVVERSYGSFMRSFTLPFDADTDKVDAVFKKGVLKITLPKPADAAEAARKIKVRSDT